MNNNTYSPSDTCTCATVQGIALLREMRTLLQGVATEVFVASETFCVGGADANTSMRQRNVSGSLQQGTPLPNGTLETFRSRGAAANTSIGGSVGEDIKKLLAHVERLEETMNASQEAHAEKLSELMRHFTHYLNMWSVRAPPDQGVPELQTVPWMVGRYNTTVAPKGELAKRTADAPPTVQKPQPKPKGRRGKGAKRARKDSDAP